MKKIIENNLKWLVLFSMASCLSLIFIDQTALPVALPIIKRNLNFSNLGLQWVLNSYLLTLASLIIVGGKISDIFGPRKIFFLGQIVFFIASCICAISQNNFQFIIGRIIQGVGASLMLPASGVILINEFSLKERGRAMGIYISSASIFLTIGPMIGGIITQYLGWRWIFWINIPFILISLFIFFFTPSKKDPIKILNVDWFGFFWLILTIIPFVFSIMEIVSFGWKSPIIVGMIMISILSAFLFIKTESGKADPIIDIDLFKVPAIRAGFIIVIFTQCAIVSIAFWPIFLQDVLDFLPGKSGLALLPATIPVMIFSPIAGKIMDKHGPYLPTMIGCFCIIFGALWISAIAWYENYYFLIPGLFIYGCAPSFLLSSTITHIMSVVKPEKRGTISGIYSFFRQLGSSLGIAIIGSIISNAYLLKFDGIKIDTFAFCCANFIIFIMGLAMIFFLKNIPNHNNDFQ